MVGYDARRSLLVKSQQMSSRSPKARSSAANDVEFRHALARSLCAGTQALYRNGRLYDRFYGRRTQHIRFYEAIARRHGGPVLELGVGTGRVAFALARAGLDVVGVDAMASMLERARANALRLPKAVQSRVELRRGDMRRLRLERRFPLVIAPFNSFTHLYDRQDWERTLAACRRHLGARGRLVFDVVMPDLRALTQNPERLYRGRDVVHERDRGRQRYYEASHYDAVRQIRSVTMVLERADTPSSQQAIPLTQRQVFPAELDALLHYNGFEIEQRYGDFEFGPLTQTSEAQVIVARPTRTASPRR
jgi:SAM-dependent methyltransferase